MKNIVEETKTGSFDYYDVNSELEEFNNGRVDDNETTLKRPIPERRLWWRKSYQKKATISSKMIKPSQKTKTFKPYTTSRIKSCNFLSKISYAGVSDDDIIDRNFCFDIYILMTKNINPFSLERKLFDQSKHEMIYMLWKDCMPDEFFKFICKKENFSYLNSKNVLHPKVSDIVQSFIAEDENNYKKLRENHFSIRLLNSLSRNLLLNCEKRIRFKKPIFGCF